MYMNIFSRPIDELPLNEFSLNGYEQSLLCACISKMLYQFKSI